MGTGGASAGTAARRAGDDAEAARLKAVAIASAAAIAAANASGNATGSAVRPTFNKNVTYTSAQKVEARAMVKKINSSEVKATTGGVCILCRKNFGTARCFELDAMASTRPPNWKSLFD